MPRSTTVATGSSPQPPLPLSITPGQPVLGRLVANRAGHALHTRFVAELLESTSHWVLDPSHEVSLASAR